MSLTTHWTCDDVDPGQMLDAQGLAALTVAGSVPLVAGRRGTARQFRQVGGVATPAANFAEAAAPSGLLAALRDSHTVAFWMKRAAGAAYDNQVLLDVRPATDPSDAEEYNLLASISLYVDGRLSVGWEHSAGINVGGLHTIPVVVGAWQHVVVRVTRTGASAAIDVFTDGVHRSSDAELGATGGATGMVAMVGAGRDNAGSLRSQLHADLDDLRIYSRALTDAEVATIARAADYRFVHPVNRGAASAAVESPRHPRLTNRGADSWRDDG